MGNVSQAKGPPPRARRPAPPWENDDDGDLARSRRSPTQRRATIADVGEELRKARADSGVEGRALLETLGVVAKESLDERSRALAEERIENKRLRDELDKARVELAEAKAQGQAVQAFQLELQHLRQNRQENMQFAGTVLATITPGLQALAAWGASHLEGAPQLGAPQAPPTQETPKPTDDPTTIECSEIPVEFRQIAYALTADNEAESKGACDALLAILDTDDERTRVKSWFRKISGRPA